MLLNFFTDVSYNIFCCDTVKSLPLFNCEYYSLFTRLVPGWFLFHRILEIKVSLWPFSYFTFLSWPSLGFTFLPHPQTNSPPVQSGLDLDWIWTGSRLDLGWIWAGSGLNLDWVWTGSGLDLGWIWTGSGLGLDLPQSVHHFTIFFRLCACSRCGYWCGPSAFVDSYCDKTISPRGPLRSCSGAFGPVKRSSSAGGVSVCLVVRGRFRALQ